MKHKVDIFEVMKAIDSRDINFFTNLTSDQKSAVAPVVLMRWLSSGKRDATHLMNVILNPLVFPLHKHQGLLYKLMVACSDGKQERYSWVKKKGKDKSAPTADLAISEYYRCSRKEAGYYRKKLKSEDILEMAEDMGYDSEKMKKIKTELK